MGLLYTSPSSPPAPWGSVQGRGRLRQCEGPLHDASRGNPQRHREIGRVRSTRKPCPRKQRQHFTLELLRHAAAFEVAGRAVDLLGQVDAISEECVEDEAG